MFWIYIIGAPFLLLPFPFLAPNPLGAHDARPEPVRASALFLLSVPVAVAGIAAGVYVFTSGHATIGLSEWPWMSRAEGVLVVGTLILWFADTPLHCARVAFAHLKAARAGKAQVGVGVPAEVTQP